jgi:hypothetical protein
MDVGEVARMSIEFRVEGMVQFNRMIDVTEQTVDEIRTSLIIEIANAYVDAVRNEIQNSGSIISGILYASTRILESGDGYVVAGSDAPHAIFWEYGHGPIVPVNAKVLHWVDPSTGKDVFAMYVGPVAGSGVFESAAVQLEKMVGDLIVERLDSRF